MFNSLIYLSKLLEMSALNYLPYLTNSAYMKSKITNFLASYTDIKFPIE